MLNEITRNTLRFLILVITQVLIVKNIDLGRYINPFVYLLFVLLLPFETPKPLLLLLGFIMGITVDIFYDTAGMHAAATVLMAYARPVVFSFFSPREGYETGTNPDIRSMGITWFLSTGGTLIAIHHLFLFYLEVFRFSELFSTFFRVLLSSVFSLGLCLLSQYLVSKQRSKE